MLGWTDAAATNRAARQNFRVELDSSPSGSMGRLSHRSTLLGTRLRQRSRMCQTHGELNLYECRSRILLSHWEIPMHILLILLVVWFIWSVIGTLVKQNRRSNMMLTILHNKKELDNLIESLTVSLGEAADRYDRIDILTAEIQHYFS